VTNVLVGTSSWTDKSLIESGRFYPPSVTTPEARLRYYSAQFPIVEIDSSYYGIPVEANARLWIERTPPGFVFNIKAYRLFTRHQTPVASLAKDIRAALVPLGKANIYEEDVPAEIALELWRAFRAVLEIVRASGKLGAVHFQFAPWVAFHPKSFDYIEHCRAMLAGFPLAIEFRNRTWFDGDKHTARTLAFERENGLANVVVDEPQGISNTIPAVWEMTDPALALVRLHGRNRETWNRKGLTASSQRFNYDYDENELREVAANVTTLSRKVKSVHVLFNTLCSAPHKLFNAEPIVMRSPLFAGPASCEFEVFLLRIKEPVHNEAMSLSVALNRPDLKRGATTDSSASSFTDESARVYISVVCILACPSHRETFRRSLVACRTVSAQVWRRTCGETRFVAKERQRPAAAWACLRRMYSNPARVMGWPRALGNSSGTRIGPLTANHARNADVVSFHKGKHRSFRPLPWTTTLACG